MSMILYVSPPLVSTLAAQYQATVLADSFELQDHCRRCRLARGRLHAWRCVGEAVAAFLAPRFITLLVAAGGVLLIGLSLPLQA